MICEFTKNRNYYSTKLILPSTFPADLGNYRVRGADGCLLAHFLSSFNSFAQTYDSNILRILSKVLNLNYFPYCAL